MTPLTEPSATYRIQFTPWFGFDSAAAIAPYLAALGVSHLYASPYLQAAPSSTHGYDVVDPSRVNEALGGADAHARMCEALRDAGLRQVVDIVPNHMAIPNRSNRWWWDVLKNGVRSKYAGYFDIDWDPPEEKLRNKVLLPVLADHYGRVLEAGDILLGRNDEEEVIIRYHDLEFPIDPSTFAADTDQAAIDAMNQDVDHLDLLLESQNYRLAFWRIAADELDYRRFFDINDLVALRAERKEVFEATHRLPIQWVREGSVDGVRVDHVDGLRDPVGYMRRLRDAVGDAWIVVEKILEAEERLPASWPVAGTTGYDAAFRIDGLFREPAGEAVLDATYRDFVGDDTTWAEHQRKGKEHIVTQVLSADVARLTNILVDVCRRRRRMRDYSRRELRAVIESVLIAFPVYRTYVVPASHQVTKADTEVIDAALQLAALHNPEIDDDLLAFVGAILRLEVGGDAESSLVERFQQLSGAVMAKGVEDTAFYRYNRLISLNEVGSDPAQFVTRPDDFHEACIEAQRLWPSAMLVATTHDTKRSDDVRHRISLLSEIPDEWACAVERWRDINERHRRPVDGVRFPDRNLEYLLYQTMVGAYPLDTSRALEYAAKVTKEAKQHTSWTEPDQAYDDAVASFVQSVGSDAEFQADLEAFVGRIIEPARVTSLAATLIRLTMPGVPDIYQGTEVWNLSLVDPDNRRPVDYGKRVKLMQRIESMSPEEIMQDSDEGSPKLHVVASALRLRNRRLQCFDRLGDYEPLFARGDAAVHVVSFCRSGEIVTAVPRFNVRLSNVGWADTILAIPRGAWRNVLTGDELEGGDVPLAHLTHRFPVVLLERL